MTGELWWSRLVNSVRFLDDIQDALTEYKSVLLFFDTDIPWRDIMIETIEARLNEHIDSKTFDVLDVSKVESPGQLQEVVRMAVWEAQIKLVFPKLENFRAEIIRKYEAKLQRFLTIRSSNNDKIDRAADLEIGQLFYVCKENRDSKITEFAEYEMIRKMRDARNTLAHWEILSYEQLKELGMI